MVDPSSIALQFEVFAGLWGLIILVVVAGIVISLLIAIWVYRDAESRGMSGVLWLLVVLVAGLLGVIIYLIVRGSHPVRPPGAAWPPSAYGAYPPPYGAPPYASPGGQYPGAPGAQPPVSQRMCRNCGAALAVEAAFCARCGAKV